MRSFSNVVLLASGALWLGACQLLLGIEDEQPRLDFSEDASTSSSSGDVDVPTFVRCAAELDPTATARPWEQETYTDAAAPHDADSADVEVADVEVGEDGSVPPIFFAVRNFKFQDGEERLGFDLDGRNTVEDGTGNARPLCSGERATDAPGGIDNQLLVALQTSLGGALDPVFKETSGELERGRLSMLLQLADYNGRADDEEVTVRIRSSPGLVGLDAGGSPNWDGNDLWNYSGPEAINGRFFESAYLRGKVAGYQLILGPGVTIEPDEPTMSLPLLGQDVPFFRSATVATLSHDAGRWELNGVLAGACRPLQLFDAFYSAESELRPRSRRMPDRGE